MRIRKRTTVVALAGVAALVTMGGAAALANDVSTLSGSKITPSKLPKTTFKQASLFVHTGTIYTHPGDKAHGGFAKTVTLLFDNDGKISTTGIPTVRRDVHERNDPEAGVGRLRSGCRSVEERLPVADHGRQRTGVDRAAVELQRLRAGVQRRSRRTATRRSCCSPG